MSQGSSFPLSCSVTSDSPQSSSVFLSHCLLSSPSSFQFQHVQVSVRHIHTPCLAILLAEGSTSMSIHCLPSSTAAISDLIHDVFSKLAKSTRLPGSLPVFYHFYPSTRFFKFLPVLGIPISKKKIKKKKKKNFVLFLPVNIGEIRELINHFRSYRP